MVIFKETIFALKAYVRDSMPFKSLFEEQHSLKEDSSYPFTSLTRDL